MAKIDLIREKFKGKINPIDFIELANNIDNSKTKKYAEHILRFTNNLSNDFELTAINEMEYIMQKLKTFDQLAKNGMIENADLNQYKNMASIKKAIKEATLTKSIGKAKKEIKVLYEDDNYMLFLPLSYDAASVYGRGTKWCVTQSEYFYRYTDKGILAYFIEKGVNRKIGLYYDMEKSYYHETLKPRTHEDLVMKLNKKSYDDEESVAYDAELMEIYNFSTKFSCWTDWDSRMEMMFVPIPLHLKELFISYCRENNIQNASLLDEVETKNLISYYEYETMRSIPEPTMEEPVAMMAGEAMDMAEMPMNTYYENGAMGMNEAMDMGETMA